MNSLFKLKFKMHKLVNIIFYLIIFVLGFFVGLTINSVSAEELENQQTYIMCNNSENLFNNNLVVSLRNATFENGVVKQSSADTKTTIDWKLQIFIDGSFIRELSPNIIDNGSGKISMNFTKDQTFNQIRFGLNGSATDTLILINVSHLIDGMDYILSFDVTNTTQGSVSWQNIYIQRVCEEIEPTESDNMFYDISKNIIGELDTKDFWVYDLITCFLAISGISIIVIVVLSIFKFFIRG